jgi:F-box protein 21
LKLSCSATGAHDADSVSRRTTTSERYVISETNIELIRDPKVVEDSPFLFAGKFFKRFDTATCTFISNIREQYPDD